MAKLVSSFSILAIALGVLLHAGAAGAQSARTWVSGAGADSGACTRAAPCATFAFAYGATSAGGEIDVLDGGDFGPLTIGHSLTIANDGAGTAAVRAFGAGPAIQITAGAGDAVVLRGLSLQGGSPSTYGVVLTSGASLFVDHCVIQGFSPFAGIHFGALGDAKLWVRDSVLWNDGIARGGSIWIAPQNGAAVTAHLERVRVFQASGNGVRADGSLGSGVIDVELHEVTVDGGSASGIVAVSATSGGPAVNIMADDVTSSHNIGFGVRAVGGTASIALSRSTVTDNARGLGVSDGGVLVSYSDNRIEGNVNGDGDPTATLPLK
jgi:hypothetical protein